MGVLNAQFRKELIKKMRFGEYELAIIGGGITGAGIALDAVLRGIKTVLIEKNDFASGTSSKSTKLIHGGLRYLKQFEIALVREVGQERAVVHQLAPHLVRSEKMLLPLIKDGNYGKLLTSFGLMIYDVLAGVEEADQRKMLDRAQTLEFEPLLDATKVEGGGLYYEYRTDDARLTMEVLKTAAFYGADVINYAEAIEFGYDDGKVTGVKWKDHLSGDVQEINARYVINAAGPWVDELRSKDQSLKGKKLHLTKGVHIVIPHEKFPINHSVYFDIPDGRMVFAIPRGRVTYVGTTDTDYHGIPDQVSTGLNDVEYLLEGIQYVFPSIQLTPEEVESSWAGLRPLIEEEGKSASELSRKDEIFESESGLLSIAGGKLTGYRKMAERILDRLVKRMYKDSGRTYKPCQTAQVPLTGGIFPDMKEVHQYQRLISAQIAPFNLKEFYADYLVGNYGKQTDTILSYFQSRKEDDPEIRLALSELTFVIEQEGVHSAMDFFERRTGRLYFNIGSIGNLVDPVLIQMKNIFNWDNSRMEKERSWIRKAIHMASHFE